MKVLLSSKQISVKLYHIILNDIQIMKVEVLTGIVNLIHKKGEIVLQVENIDGKGISLVGNVRFDHLCSVASKIKECPVILDFGENKCNLIIQF